MATIYYRVKARNAAGDSAPSNTDTVSVTELPAGAPTNPTVVPYLNFDGQMQVSFGTVPDASVYEVYRSTTNGFTPGVGNKLGAEPSGSPWIDLVGLSPNTRYYYRLLAKNSAGYTLPNYSVQFTGVTHVDRPQSFNATQDYTACPTVRFDLTWSNTNSNGNVRSEGMILQWYNGSTWTTITPNPPAGSTSYTATVTSAVQQFRIRYSTESVYATDNIFDASCPE